MTEIIIKQLISVTNARTKKTIFIPEISLVAVIFFSNKRAKLPQPYIEYIILEISVLLNRK